MLVPLTLLVATLAAPSGDTKAIDALAKRWFQTRPATCFEEWDPAAHAALLAEARALGPLPEGSLDAVRDQLWKQARRELARPAAGLILGLHGGGAGAGDAESASEWRAPGYRAIHPQAIRLVDDAWNTVHGERFLLGLIERAKIVDEIDPDRVCVAGFSMGGTGSWFLAGRHPDLLAAAAPCAGVLMAEPKSQLATKQEVVNLQHGLLPNVRNLAMNSFIGLADKNCMPGTFLFAWDRIAELRANDPGGYAGIQFRAVEKLAHAYPPGEPAACIRWMVEQRRDAFPAKLVWEYAAAPFPLPAADEPVARFEKRWFYWLHCAAPADRMRVVAERDGNTFDLRCEGVDPGLFTILLNPRMIDPAADVVVRVDGIEVYRGRPEPDVATVLESLDARLDRTLVFDRRVALAPRE